ncbi:MAG: hypothetical protein WAW79_08120, partial [Steroidobacteraceae bacterium]
MSELVHSNRELNDRRADSQLQSNFRNLDCVSLFTGVPHQRNLPLRYAGTLGPFGCDLCAGAVCEHGGCIRFLCPQRQG